MLCPASTFQRVRGQTACETCVPGFYCREGAAEPVPCPGGTFGNATGLYNTIQCLAVPIDFWAPLGSALPEPCPESGFYCPGRANDPVYGGSKPIIMPVGQSTKQQDAPAVTKEMMLDLSIDDFELQREALKIQLAAQYGVDPSLLTLEASAGSVQLRITIATTNGDGTSIDLATIEQSVAAIDDTALATTIGNVTGTAVTVVSQPLQTSSVRVTVVFRCPRGSWCTAGNVIPCPTGTYNPLEDQDFATACVLCPENSYTLSEGSIFRRFCKCRAGFYDHNNSIDVDLAVLALTTASGNATTSMDDVVDCRECPVGTACSSLGSSLQGLPIARGFYRLNGDSTDVRECPDARKNCSTTFGTTLCQSSSGCEGGEDFLGQCAPGLTGVYCRECDRSDGQNVFYRGASEDDVAKCAPCGDTLVQTALLYGGVIVGMVLGVALLLAGWRRLPKSTVERLHALNASFTPRNKIKVLIGFYQLTTQVPSVYEVALPPEINDLLDQLSTGISFGLQSIATTPLECLGFVGYQWRLLTYTAMPPVLVLAVVLVVLVGSCVGGNKKAISSSTKMGRSRRAATKPTDGAPPTNKREGTRTDDTHGSGFALSEMTFDGSMEYATTFFDKCLPAVMTLLFVIYPLVTKVAFEAFSCYWFMDGTRGFLRADVAIECNTPRHDVVMSIAWGAVAAYPVGIWVFCLVLLFKASPAIIAGKETPLAKALGFLYREYDVTCFWWELVEMLRKFLLVGLFVTVQPGSIMQIAVGTIVAATYLMVQLQANPYRNRSDNYLAVAASFSLLMVFFCSIIFKYDALTVSEDLQTKMSIEQKQDYIVDNTILSFILFVSVIGALAFAALLVVVQIIVEIKENAKLRRLKYVTTGKWVECKTLSDLQAFHLFLSHAWPAAQDRMRIVKARLLEALPTCKTFLDVDDLKSGSGTAEVDKSECVLVFCTSQYFEKKNSLKELYRAVCQRRPILAMLEPDATQEGGLNQAAVEALISNVKLDKFKLRKKWAEWNEDGELLAAAFDHAPDEADVRAALFAMPPVEWNRLPHFQDVTIRLIAQNGILGGKGGALYLQGEAATGKVSLPSPLKGREYHLFCSPFNAGAAEVAEELRSADIFVTKGKKASAPLTHTADVSKLESCDHMLVLLDKRTWTSGEDTAKLVEHIHTAMKLGVRVSCVHEFPGVVGPPRHECDFGLMFNDDWTPRHLTSGPTNLYKDIALALKGVEWRQPGLVAFASKLAASAGPHKPIAVVVPETYEPATGAKRLPLEEAMAAVPAPAPLPAPKQVPAMQNAPSVAEYMPNMPNYVPLTPQAHSRPDNPLQGIWENMTFGATFRIEKLLTPSAPPIKAFTLSDQKLGLGLSDEADGAVVRRLKPGSQAETLGVTIGGKITAVNGEVAATNKKDLNAQLTSAARPITLLVTSAAASDSTMAEQVEAMIRTFDVDGGSIISPNEFHALLVRIEPTVTLEETQRIYEELLESGYDADEDGQLSVTELTTYWVEMSAKRSVQKPDLSA